MRSSFAERYRLELWVGKKNYFRAPVAACFAVGDMEAMDRPALGLVQLEVPVIIANQMSFFATLDGKPEYTDEFKLWVVLGNLHARGVQ